MKIRSLVAVVGSSDRSHDSALRVAKFLADWHEATLHVVEAAALGRGVRGIAAYADRVSADLVVVGPKVRHGLYWRTGSFAAALGKAVQSPTLVVPDGDAGPMSRDALFRNVVVPVDFSPASVAAVGEALTLVQQSGGHLRLLHVLEAFPYESAYSGSRAFALIREFRASVERANRRLRSLVPPDVLNWASVDVATVSGRVQDAIVATASGRTTDLVVLGLPRRSRLEEVIAGSTVHGTLRRLRMPVLLVPAPPGAAVAAHPARLYSAA